MDEVELVVPKLAVRQIDDGRTLLSHLEKEGFPITVACWVKPFDEDRWSLTIATPLVNEKGSLAAYRRLLGVQRESNTDWITDSDIALISENDRLAREVLNFQGRFPGRMAEEVNYPLVGDVPAERLYVYPLRQMEIPLYGMVFRGSPGEPLNLSFTPFSPDAKMIIGRGDQAIEYPAETGIDWLVAAPEGATLQRDETGRSALAWDLHGRRRRSTANEVWSFAKLGINGFRFLREPAMEVASTP